LLNDLFFKNYFLTGFAADLETGFATGFEDAMNEILLSSTFIPLFTGFVAI
jgi:hypothetical protein